MSPQVIILLVAAPAFFLLGQYAFYKWHRNRNDVLLALSIISDFLSALLFICAALFQWALS